MHNHIQSKPIARLGVGYAFFLSAFPSIALGIALGIVLGIAFDAVAAAAPVNAPPVNTRPDARLDERPNARPNERFDESWNELIVSATGIATPRDQLGSAVTVLTEADLARLQTPNIVDALVHVPGVSFDQEGVAGGIGYLRIRGLDRQYVTVLVDGIQLGDPADPFGSAEISNLISAGIGRVEVLRGSHSVLYGSNAIAGTINLITPRLSGPVQTQLSVEAGSRDLRRVSALIGGGETLRGFVLLSHDESRPSSDFSKQTPGFIEREDYENQSITSRFDLDLDDRQHVFLFARAGRVSAERDGYDANYQAVDGWFGENTHELATRLGYQFELSEQDHIGASLTYFSRDRDSFEDPSSGAQGYWNDGSRMKAQIDGQFALGAAGRLAVGAEHINERFSQKGLRRKEAEMRAGFVMAHYQFLPSLSSSFGARVDHHDRFGSHASYRLGVALKPTEQVVFRASYGTGFRAPSLYELYGENAYCSQNLCGNAGLTPELSESYDAGAELTIGDVGLNVTLFKVTTQDKIIFSNAKLHYENDIGKSKSEGVEASVDYALSAFLTTQLSATYVDPRASDGSLANKQPRQILSWDIDYQWPNEKGSMGVFIRDVSHRYIYGVRQDDYTLIGLRGQWNLRNAVQLTARVENALNEDYTTSYGNPPRTTPRRELVLGVRAQF